MIFDFPESPSEVESTLKSLYKAIDEGYCLCELVLDGLGRPVDYRFLEVNPLFEQISGLSNVCGRTAFEVIPNLEPSWLEMYADVALRGIARRFEQESVALGRWYSVFAAAVAPRGRFALLFRDITAQKHTEAALRESERHARAMIDSLADGFLSVSADWRITYINPQGEELVRPLGLGRQQLIGLSLWEAFPGLAGTPFVALFQKAMQESRSQRIEEYFAPLDSWFDVRCYTAQGGLSIHFRDITATKRANEAIRQSEIRFRELAEAMPQLVWTATREGEVEYYNSRVSDYHGAWQDEQGRWRWSGLLHEEDRAPTMQAWERALRLGVAYQATHRVQMSTGDYRWHLSRGLPVRDAEGRIARWYGAATDVHDLRVAEDALRESEARFRTMTEALPQMVWSSDAAGSIDFFNARWYEFTGVAEGASDGEAWRVLFHPDDQAAIAHRWRHSLRTGDALEIESRLRHRSGGYRWVLGRTAPVREGGRIVRWLGSFTDIHEMKQAQDHRRMLMEELNHRVKNTLAVVQSLAFQTLRTDRGPSEQRAALEGRLRALAAAHEVLTRESWASVSLREIITSTRNTCGVEPNRIRLAGPDLMLQPKQGVALAMAFHELCTNALKYGSLSSPDGMAAVAWEVRDGGEFSFTWRESGGPVVQAPVKLGFGTRMLRRLFVSEFGAAVDLTFEPSGFICKASGWLGRPTIPK